MGGARRGVLMREVMGSAGRADGLVPSDGRGLVKARAEF
jgi:hypothetical protein